jgi:CRP/FNR family transcriptional regulator
MPQARPSQDGPIHSETRTEAHAAPRQDQHRVVSIPGTDTLFRHTVGRHIQSVRERRATIRAARRSLRQRYPDAELSCQGDGIVRGESVELWFAYRDGRAEANTPQARWWDDRGLARVVIDTAGRLIRPNAACRRLLDMPPGNAGAITVSDLVSPELYQELRRESKRLSATETWDGSLSLRLPSGRRLDIEFHARRDETARRLEVAMRSLSDRDRANDFMALEQSALGSMPAVLLTELFRGSIRRKLGSGERLTPSLRDDAWVVLVTAGIVRLYIAMDGYEPTLAYGNAGSLFGTHVMVPSDAFVVGLQAVTPSVVLQLSARRVEELAESNVAFARALSEDAQIHLREVVRSFAAHAAGNLRQRLAREITLLSDLEADDEFVSVTEQQLADGVGSIRESIGRSIADLRRDGSIATTRHGLLILDKERLRAVGSVGLD